MAQRGLNTGDNREAKVTLQGLKEGRIYQILSSYRKPQHREADTEWTLVDLNNGEVVHGVRHLAMISYPHKKMRKIRRSHRAKGRHIFARKRKKI